MLRSFLPPGPTLALLFTLWVSFSVVIGVFAPQIRGAHLKVAGYGLLCAVVSFVFLSVVLGAIVVLFN